jgi:hypothetical protein
LELKECIWRLSNLRNKFALKPTLDEFGDLFTKILDVPDATLAMLIAELRDICVAAEQVEFEYCKSLLLEISRKRETNDELEQLKSIRCWPCRSPSNKFSFCAIGEFYVNDRQLLYDMFQDSHPFLDLDFDSTQDVSGLLRKLHCTSFLSKQVTVETEACQPLLLNDELTQDYRIRCLAIKRCVHTKKCGATSRLLMVLQIP